MSSANPKSHEPSMEEILASIRRIISDEQPPKQGAEDATARAAEPPRPKPELLPPPAPLEDDILDLEDEAAPTPPTQAEPPRIETPEAREEAFVARPEPPAPPPMPQPRYEPPPAPEPPPLPPMRDLAPARDEGLMSRQTDEAVSNAFQTLAGSILAGSQRTLDDIVAEMLRPMLKGWLDDNLPGIVERLVRAEIERVARGGR